MSLLIAQRQHQQDPAGAGQRAVAEKRGVRDGDGWGPEQSGGGAAGAAAGTITAPVMMDALQAASVDEALAKGLTALGSTTVGSIAGGTAGGAAAMNEVANNYLSHMERQRLNDAKRACISAGQQCETATALQKKDELSDKLLANAAAVCKGADCREVVLFVTKEMERLGCASGPYAVCNHLWDYQYAAQLKAQGLESVCPESWLLDAKAAVDLGKLGINLLARSGKDSLTSLRQLELMKSNDIASTKIGLNFYRDNGSINPFADRISELASQATKNEFSDTVVLGKYIENSSQSYEKLRMQGALPISSFRGDRGAMPLRSLVGIRFGRLIENF